MSEVNEKLINLKKKLEEQKNDLPLDEKNIPQDLNAIKEIVGKEVRYQNSVQYKGIENKLHIIRDGINGRLEYIEKLLEEFILQKKG